MGKYILIRFRTNKLTINVPVVYMTRDVMILMGANPLQGPLEGVGLENQDLLGHWSGNEGNSYT